MASLRVAFRRPDKARLLGILGEQSGLSVTYPDVGATVRGETPPGYTPFEGEAIVGLGQGTFEAARDALRAWKSHLGAGVDIYPADARVQRGETVILLPKVGGTRVVAAVRIVQVTDEPHTFGFSYGTLPLHPERGEERFVVWMDPSETVYFTVSAFSRPSSGLSKLGSPVGTIVQRRTNKRYLSALVDAARQARK